MCIVPFLNTLRNSLPVLAPGLPGGQQFASATHNALHSVVGEHPLV